MKALFLAIAVTASASVAFAQSDTTGPTGKAQGTGSAGGYGNAGNSAGSSNGTGSYVAPGTGSGTAGGGASGEVRNSAPVGTQQNIDGDPAHGQPTDRAVPNAARTRQGG